MKFFSFATLLTAAGLACATNTVTFISQDTTNRMIYFAENPGCASIDATSVPGGKNVTVTFPEAWQGNCFSVSEGEPVTPGMLAEFSWNGWNNLNYFDVSAIVNPSDKNGIKQLWPANEGKPISGCEEFPCDSAYYLPDDVQTKATTDTELYCTLGTGSGTSTLATRTEPEDSPSFARDFILGKWSGKRA